VIRNESLSEFLVPEWARYFISRDYNKRGATNELGRASSSRIAFSETS
jgi:hypothetical protein